MNNKIGIIVFLILIPFTLFGELKESIVIIKPELNQSIVDAYKKKAEELAKNGQEKLSHIYESFTRNGFGSGFVISNKDGELFIITNKHVVEFSGDLHIFLEQSDGKRVEIDGASLEYLDRYMDLALIRVGKNEFLRPLDLSDKELSDGEVVWAAGYPGLLGEPGWQLSSGNITNKLAVIQDATWSSGKTFIQHSATIDPGNSGGPLLIKDETKSSGFSVIGVNTLSISNRNNTFFAIPNSLINQFLQNSVLNKNPDISGDIDTFLTQLSSENINQDMLLSFISSELIGLIGLESYDIVLNSSDVSLKNRWKDSLYNHSPTETLSGAIYERIVDAYSSDIRGEIIKLEKKDIELYNVKLGLNNKKIDTVWGLNNGLWQLENISLDNKFIYQEKTDEKKDENVSNPVFNIILPGLTQFQHKDYNKGFTYSLLAIFGAYITLSSFGDQNPDFLQEQVRISGSIIFFGTGIYSFIDEIKR